MPDRKVIDRVTGQVATHVDAGDGTFQPLSIARQPPGDIILPAALQAVVLTANGQSADLDVSKYIEIDCFLNITAASGTTPTLTFDLDAKAPDGSNTYASVISFGAKTATGLTLKSLCGAATDKGFGNIVRLRWSAIGGTTPSFTVNFSMIGKYA